MRGRWSQPLAWTLIALTTTFWLWFGTASAVSERLGVINTVIHLLLPGGAFLLIAAIAWRWRRLGAALLIVAGLAMAVAYPLTIGRRFPESTIVMVILTMAAPPFAAGVLLLEGPAVDRSARNRGGSSERRPRGRRSGHLDAR
jgi:hypothetical protein